MSKWPTYRKYVENNGVDPDTVSKLSDLPLINKEFLESAINAIPPYKIRRIIPSSGTTGGNNSFGLFGDRELESSSGAIDSYLVERFNTGNISTLLMNMLPGGISITNSTVTIASIGTRADTAINVIKSFGNAYDQIILIAEPLFIKHLLEEGIEQFIPWKHFNIQIVTGGEWFSESYRTYIESIVGFGRIQSSMGTAELGLNYFIETSETIALRRLFFHNRTLASTFLKDLDFTPMLFDYNEKNVFVETLCPQDKNDGSIILSTIDPERVLPLIRYEIGDKGILFSKKELNEVMNSMGYPAILNSSTGHILAHLGRGNRIGGISPEIIKEILFCQISTASTTTGQFSIFWERDETSLLIQLKKGFRPNKNLKKIYTEAFSSIPVNLTLTTYSKYPYELNFERKVGYIYENNCHQN